MNDSAVPSLSALPPPEPGRTGWPWTVASAALPRVRADGRAWPKISIITPSFNQGRYLEETIRSVLLQGYPNLEFFIIDGGSKDQTVEIIKKYEGWLAGWVSERDRGQCEAINKGYARCTGEIFTWLCSDDLLAPNALAAVAEAFIADPALDAVAGPCYLQYDNEPAKSATSPSSVELLRRSPFGFTIWQPSCFFRRSLITRPQLVLDEMVYCMDRELWCYIRSRGAKWKELAPTLSINRFTGENKSLTGRARIISELDVIYRRYAGRHSGLTFWLRKVWLPLVLTSKRHRLAPVRVLSQAISRVVTLLLRIRFPAEWVQILQKEFFRYAI